MLGGDNIKMTIIESNNLDAIGYKSLEKALFVWCHDGRVYRYDNISKSIYDNLISSDSKERYIKNNIISNYPQTELSNLE